MHYVKELDINGVATKQVACIELHGKPNAATEGYPGVLGIDIDSPLHDVYKCVAVNGSVYSWELLSSGLSIMSATVSGEGASSMQFPYSTIKKPTTYVIKRGDLILDREGYVYTIEAINVTYCEATYTGTRIVAHGRSAYDLAVLHGYMGTELEWLDSLNAVAIVTNVSVSCDSSAWVEDTAHGGYYQTIPVEGIRSTDTPIVDVVLGDDVSANEEYLRAWSAITRVTTDTDAITLYANNWLPLCSFPMQMKVMKGGDGSTGDGTTIVELKAQMDRIETALGELLNASFTLYCEGIDTTYDLKMRKGMTWGEWCASDYNTIGAYVGSTTSMPVYWDYNGESHMIYYVYDSYHGNVQMAHADEVITDGHQYVCKNWG